jgi:hypothetical protein
MTRHNRWPATWRTVSLALVLMSSSSCKTDDGPGCPIQPAAPPPASEELIQKIVTDIEDLEVMLYLGELEAFALTVSEGNAPEDSDAD